VTVLVTGLGGRDSGSADKSESCVLHCSLEVLIEANCSDIGFPM
jgi:hypothetical protein